MVGEHGVTKTILEKGREGEIYITQEVCKLGYRALYVGGSQRYKIDGERYDCVDILIWKNGKTLWLQAKNKPPRRCYPDTGMAVYQYNNLLKHQKETGIAILVLFTDKTKKIYGNWLDDLPTCLSMTQFNQIDNCMMIYWLRDKLKDYKELLR